MAAQYDLVIRNGTIIDGSGGDPSDGDVAVLDGKIAAMGSVDGSGKEEIDAKGNLVTPGFVDIHTHYDGQITWDERVQPSSIHGVTTVVTSNCGVGFAPCREADHDTLIRLMEGVEDIPGTALAEGLPWTWESFPEFLDHVEKTPHDIDIATMVPHGALRVYVMGERGVRRDPASDEDIASMQKLVTESIAKGALGLSTSRTVIHRTADGDPTPMYEAAAREVLGIASGIKEGGGGVFQMVSDFAEIDRECGLLRDVVRQTGCPASFSLLQPIMEANDWRRLLGFTTESNEQGLKIRAQVFTRPVGVLLGFEASLNPFMLRPTYKTLLKLDFAERVRKLAEPVIREKILGEEDEGFHPFLALFGRRYEYYFPMPDPVTYEPPKGSSVGALAEKQGRSPLEVVYDLLLEKAGRGLIYFTFANYRDFNLDAVHEMMAHEHTTYGLGDGGAHVGMICDGSGPTSTLSHWGRDRADDRFSIPWLVRFLTRSGAETVGLLDRGLLEPGLKADLNVIDMDAIGVKRPEIQHDLPAGGRRFMQRASGYLATIVSGVTTYRDGESTGQLRGQLVRGHRGD